MISNQPSLRRLHRVLLSPKTTKWNLLPLLRRRRRRPSLSRYVCLTSLLIEMGKHWTPNRPAVANSARHQSSRAPSLVPIESYHAPRVCPSILRALPPSPPRGPPAPRFRRGPGSIGPPAAPSPALIPGPATPGLRKAGRPTHRLRPRARGLSDLSLARPRTSPTRAGAGPGPRQAYPPEVQADLARMARDDGDPAGDDEAIWRLVKYGLTRSTARAGAGPGPLRSEMPPPPPRAARRPAASNHARIET